MVTGVNHIDNLPALRSVAGAGFVRPDDERPRNPDEEFAALDQEHKDSGEHGQGASERSMFKERGAGEPVSGEGDAATGTGARAPPHDPGLVMARQLAGDGKSDKALSRLLEDLDGINSVRPEDEDPRDSAPPVAPFTYSNSVGGRFHRAASAYEWGHQTLNSENALPPGVVYNEQF